MNPIKLVLWNLIYRPIFNIIVLLLILFNGNLGFSIIFLTLIIRLIILKPSLQANNMQKDMVDIQPRLKELQEQYKDDPQKLGEETMKLFKTSNQNPIKGCMMMFIQIPIFLGLFYVIKDLSIGKADVVNIYSFLYPFVHQGFANINQYFLGIDLFAKGQTPNLIIALIAGLLMYLQIKLTMLNRPSNTSSIPQMPGMPQMPDMSKMMSMMNYFMVFMMVMFVYNMPAGIGLYILTTTFFTIMLFIYQNKELIKIKMNLYIKNKG